MRDWFRGYLRAVSVAPPPDAESYPFTIPAVRRMGQLELDPKVTFLIGENGSGKSTIIEAIAVAAGFNPEGGGRNFNFATRATHSSLANQLKLIRNPVRARDGYFLRAESMYNLASEIEDLGPCVMKYYGGMSLHERSHGEAFMATLLHRCFGTGLYIFDEPEAALSPMRPRVPRPDW